MHEKQPCHICGDTSYSWGSMGTDGFRLQKQNPDVLDSFADKMLKGRVKARLCNTCKNIQLFAEHVKLAE